MVLEETQSKRRAFFPIKWKQYARLLPYQGGMKGNQVRKWNFVETNLKSPDTCPTLVKALEGPKTKRPTLQKMLNREPGLSPHLAEQAAPTFTLCHVRRGL